MSAVSQIMYGVMIAAAILGILYMVTNWCAKDATRRGRSPALVCIAVIFFFPWGLIAWLVFRPDPVEPHTRPFNLDDYRQQ